MATLTPNRFRFGLFEFDSSTHELRRDGVPVRLQAQPAQVLGILVGHAGKVVSREELRQAVWGAETFVDFERGLNFCISQVRSALRDDSSEPRFIRTVPKQGYQFIAPVEIVTAPAETSPMTPPPLKGFTRNRVAAIITAIAIVAILMLVTASWRRAKTATGNPPYVAVLRFDNETGNPALDRFSDGLSDNVVEQLTSASDQHYAVIGNAQILRLPRDQRDLQAIGTSLHARYVVLGQVQASGAHVRILAHLIRLPEQTHLWVVRTERNLAAPLTSDPLPLEAEIAKKIGAEFSTRLTADLTQSASHPPTSH